MCVKIQEIVVKMTQNISRSLTNPLESWVLRSYWFLGMQNNFVFPMRTTIKLALCRQLSYCTYVDFRPKHMLKQLPTIVKRSSFCKSQEHCWEHVLHCYIPFILFWSRFSNYKLINDAVPCHLSGNKLIRTIALWQWECVYSSISTDATSIINCMYGILK